MESLNHQHLYYFWHTVREGGMVAASKLLNVSQPTISVQINELEKFFGKPLFNRLGKSLEITEFGKLVAKYAEEIFSTTNELLEVAKGTYGVFPELIRIGMVDVIPKPVAFDLLNPVAVKIAKHGSRFSVTEGSFEQLLAEISSRNVDIIISDQPLPPDSRARIFSKKLKALKVNLVAEHAQVQKLKTHFPKSIDNAPMLLPKRNTMLRRELDLWFYERKLSPKIVAEFDDTALMKEFAEVGLGAMPIAGDPSKDSGLEKVGEFIGLAQHFFLLFPEKKRLDMVIDLFPKGRFTT